MSLPASLTPDNLTFLQHWAFQHAYSCRDAGSEGSEAARQEPRAKSQSHWAPRAHVCTHAGVIPQTVWVAIMCLPETRFLTSHMLLLFVPIILWFAGILQHCSGSKSLLLLRNPAQMADTVSQKAMWKISSVFRCQTQRKSPEWMSESSRASHSSRWRCERENEESKNHSKQTQESCGNIYTSD